VQRGVIREKEDIYYLSFEEFREGVRTNRLDGSIITERKEEHKVFEKLTPPRLMTSEGEVLSGEYDTGNIPKGALAGIPASSGTIEGRVKSPGTNVVLSDAIISVEDINAPFPAPNPAVMDQRGLRFLPHVLPVVVGTTVEFPNNDPLAHNVFSISRAKRFNLGLYGRGVVRRVKFDRPGIVELLCNVHQEMSAYIVVLKNPYFARAAADGTFRIVAVPPGKHQLRWWHEQFGEHTREVEVPLSGTAVVTLAFE
jgi:plastocyanin